jgi:hypothetical protein
METPLIFVSHAAVDQEIALSIKDKIKQLFPVVDVFVSSDPEDLPLGDPWVEHILGALKRTNLILTLATERGLSRKWVWFESGRTWSSEVQCIPCCLGKIRKTTLPPPFQSLQGINLDEAEDFQKLILHCSKKFNIHAPSSDVSTFIVELIRLDVRAEERQRTMEDPFSAELTQEVEKVMRAFDAGTTEALRLLLVYGEMTERAVADRVRRSPKYTNQSMFLIGIANRTGWLLNTQVSPYPNVSREDDRFIIAPRIRPYIAAWFERNK